MSKRRINKQQAARIEKMQADYRQKTNKSNKDGLVLTRFGSHAEIEDVEGNRIHCSIRPNLGSLVAGDRVIWQAENPTQGVVLSRYPRQSTLGRPNKYGVIKPVAANISQLIVVIATKPELSWPLLDSYLIMAEYLSLQVCIVLNKTDLPCKTIQDALLTCYQPLGYPLLFISKFNEQDYDLLKKTLQQQTSVFVGQSGVGKSSLIAKMLPHEDNIQTAEISTGSELGCHTTSNSRFYHLPSGGALIDSPGVREFGLWHMSIADITRGYREFNSLARQCKFGNCNHSNTPGCALKIALSEGKITQKRYDNFMKIIDQFGKYTQVPSKR